MRWEMLVNALLVLIREMMAVAFAKLRATGRGLVPHGDFPTSSGLGLRMKAGEEPTELPH